MQEKRNKGFDWLNLNAKAQDILGDDFWNSLSSSIPKRGPNIDIFKTENEIIAVIEVPGIRPSDKISIRVRNSKLVVIGVIPWLYPVVKEEMIHSERFTGEFKREIGLPEDVSPNGQIDAQFQNGLILVRIPRIPAEDEKEIPINFDNQ